MLTAILHKSRGEKQGSVVPDSLTEEQFREFERILETCTLYGPLFK